MRERVQNETMISGKLHGTSKPDEICVILQATTGKSSKSK
jgi:hypothetical protein